MGTSPAHWPGKFHRKVEWTYTMGFHCTVTPLSSHLLVKGKLGMIRNTSGKMGDLNCLLISYKMVRGHSFHRDNKTQYIPNFSIVRVIYEYRSLLQKWTHILYTVYSLLFGG